MALILHRSLHYLAGAHQQKQRFLLLFVSLHLPISFVMLQMHTSCATIRAELGSEDSIRSCTIDDSGAQSSQTFIIILTDFYSLAVQKNILAETVKERSREIA